MKNIVGIKIGNTVNISIDGKTFKKVSENKEVANKLFELVLKAKENPTDENIDKIFDELDNSGKRRISNIPLLDVNLFNNKLYLAGFNTPIPDSLVDVIKDYHENNWPVQPILNFWKLLMINPDKRIRKTLFDFINSHDFVLTDAGYMLVYKACITKPNFVPNELIEFVSNQYLHVKKDWTCSPNKYAVLESNNTFSITKRKTAEKWKLRGDEIVIVGRLGDLYQELIIDGAADANSAPYTDRQTKSMSIQLGIPVVMDRKECDGDPAIECSYGLHVGSTKYVEKFASWNREDNNVILVCLVNPAHVVAVPKYDNSKMRVSEYFPMAVATYTDGKIDIVEQKYFENDYKAYEEKELNEMIARIKRDENPIEKAIKGKKDKREMSELLKILETRLIDIT